MVNAYVINAYGGTDAMSWEEVDVPTPGSGEIKIRQHAAGLNYIDVYIRTGAYPQPDLPFILGMEVAGEVVEVGASVTDVSVGDRVAYAGAIGGYAEERLLPADRAMKLPDNISYEAAAAMSLQGLTAWFLLHKTYNVTADSKILVHAAAGGVGMLLCQWANHIGATVIGTAGSDAKTELAKAHGATHVINYETENFEERVRELTNGEGVDVVYDAVGKAFMEGTLKSLRPMGLWALFGAASGPISDFNLGLLMQHGSLFVTRPSLFHYCAKKEDLAEGAAALFKVVGDGVLKVNINQTYPLVDAPQAHQDLEARKTTGSTIFNISA